MRVLLEEYRSAELASMTESSTLIFPVGSTEQHGPHLPVATDALVAQFVARAAAAKVTTGGAPMLVAPTLNFGASDHHLPRAGTISITGGTYLAFLNEMLASAAKSGFRRMVILNGHGGNEDLARQASRDTAVEHPVVIAAAGYWTMAWPSLVEICAAHGLGPLPGHAGAFEASVMQHLAPEFVEMATVRTKDAAESTPSDHPLAVPAIETHGWIAEIDGYSNGARAASALAGAQAVSSIVEATAAFLEDFSKRQLPPLVVRSGRNVQANQGSGVDSVVEK
jgi:creatinine amidohydrolase